MMKRSQILIVLMLVLTLTLCACGANITGVWSPVGGGSAPDGFPDSMDLYSNGSGVCDDISVSYIAENGRLKIDGGFWGALTYEYKLNGNKLTLSSDGESVEYVKQ